MQPFVHSLYIHPIKSCGIVRLDIASVTKRGLMSGDIGDRRWFLVDPERKQVVTQRRFPSLTLMRVDLLKTPERQANDSAAMAIYVWSRGHGELVLVPKKVTNEIVTGTHFGKKITGHAVSDPDADAFFSDYVGKRVRLAYQTDEDYRYCDPNFVGNETSPVSAADGYPILVTTTGSLNEINQESNGQFAQANFRPNIVVQNAPARAENGWKRIEIKDAILGGDVMLELVKPCTRCQVPTIDLKTGKLPDMVPNQIPEPTRTLRRTRGIKENYGNVVVKGEIFGENAVTISEGTIAAGDFVNVIESKAPPKWISLDA